MNRIIIFVKLISKICYITIALQLLAEESVIVFLPEFDVELKDFNMRVAKNIITERCAGMYEYAKNST